MPKPAKPVTSAAPARASTTPPNAAKAREAAGTSQPGKGMDKAARSDALNLRVTSALKQRFKQAAKEQGLKKAAFLEKLLTEWQARNPAPATVAPPAVARPTKQGKKPGRTTVKRKA